jgi:hypothetical protein
MSIKRETIIRTVAKTNPTKASGISINNNKAKFIIICWIIYIRGVKFY